MATLKGKINGLEETCKALSEELNFYKNEIANLRDEKQDLEANLAKKTDEMRKQLVADVTQAEEDLKTSHETQKAENHKITNAIKTLKTEKTNLHQHLLDLKRRVNELEQTIGDDQN